MGMFDYVRCHYPLPSAGLDGRAFQTKDAPGVPSLETYEIRADGTLWTRVNKRWEQVSDFTGEIRFYDAKHYERSGWGRGWVEFSAYFVAGMLREIHCVRDEDE